MEKKLKETSCDFCRGRLLLSYEVPDSAMGMHVMICSNCGLAQSIQTKPKPEQRTIKASSGADWGNIRHGKGLRFEKSLPLLERFVPWQEVGKVLDVGANRGHFVLWCKEYNPKAMIVAVEPDNHVVEKYANAERIQLINDRLENIKLPAEHFDFVYCSHTLEHALSARQMVEDITKTLKHGGHLFLEVPNIEVIQDADVVEEFFIDKHTFHFNRSVLLDLLRAYGFEVVFGEEETDRSNITIIAKKTIDSSPAVWSAEYLPKENSNLINNYQTILTANRNKLKNVAKKLSALAERQALVCWGGGRIFDALVKFGDLETKNIKYVVDKYLAQYLDSVHGLSLKDPNYLRTDAPDIVVILAKSSADEIEQEIRRYGVRHVVKFRELLANL